MTARDFAQRLDEAVRDSRLDLEALLRLVALEDGLRRRDEHASGAPRVTAERREVKP